MDVTKHDPKAQPVTGALTWGDGCYALDLGISGKHKKILFSFFFHIEPLQFTFAPRAEEAHAT